MPVIEPRPLRIIASQLEARERAERSSTRRFDYAALARRARAKLAQQVSADDGASADSDAQSSPIPDLFLHSADDGLDDERGGANGIDLPHGRGAAKAIELTERISSSTLPIVDAMYRTQGQFIKLAATLATEVASFCGDPSITASGNWDAQLPLDRTILPDTVLYLSLSPFRLSLRFDTQSALSRQLLLDHSTFLERELDSLLRAWGTPRDIELTVW
ncbi:type III secretion system protein SctP [Trinickia sp. LjRoot230]|uniref:type III secretion system protein SctP n=1 Tax=Trinickia sp. LjRoot230 TaxID=3342288 RepID=UPI003ED0BFD4